MKSCAITLKIESKNGICHTHTKPPQKTLFKRKWALEKVNLMKNEWKKEKLLSIFHYVSMKHNHIFSCCFSQEKGDTEIRRNFVCSSVCHIFIFFLSKAIKMKLIHNEKAFWRHLPKYSLNAIAIHFYGFTCVLILILRWMGRQKSHFLSLFFFFYNQNNFPTSS